MGIRLTRGFRRSDGKSRWLAWLLWLLPAAAAIAAAPVTPPGAQAPPTLLRPLRENVPFSMPEPIDPKVFAGYPGVPPFSVVPRKDQLMFFPCTNCHSALKPNPQPRKLVAAPHPAALLHGNGRFWCLTCHQLNGRDQLHTLADQPVDFDQAYLVCGQCHFNRQKDWFFGGHGKRVGNWTGDRVIYNCTFCHDPHDPTLKPRAPSPKPPVRAGLQPMKPVREPATGVPHGVPLSAPGTGGRP